MSKIGIATGIFILTVIAGSFFYTYFNESVFYLNQHKYKQADAQGDVIRYSSPSSPSVEVHRDAGDRKVTIDHETYWIRKQESGFQIEYEVRYPNGRIFKVTDQDHRLMSFDENGDWFAPVSFYVNGEKVLGEGEELYHPIELVKAAYPEYHTKQGEPVFMVFAVLFLIYGWCGYRYVKFQNFLFKISLYRIWVKDAEEPSDFYYFMCKVGGIIAMILSAVLFFRSL